MTDELPSRAFFDLFKWWVGEFEAAERFYSTWSHLPSSVPPDDYDWTAASTAADRLLNHAPTSAPEAICLIEVLIDEINDRPHLAPSLRAIQSFLAQGLLAGVVGPAPHPTVVTYASDVAA